MNISTTETVILANMPDPKDPIFLPRLNINRSELGWLAEAGEGCGLLEDAAPCDPCDRRVCSYYSPCDNKTTKREHPVTKHSYYDCCVKVSPHQLLNHWLNDHKDPEPGNNNAEVLHIVNCQSESGLSSGLARLQSSEGPHCTPLHLVLRHCARVPDILKMVQFVLDTRSTDVENNLVIDTPDELGDTPLLLVSCLLDEGRFEEAKEVAERLLERGADPETRNKAGLSVLAQSLRYQDSSLSLTRSLLHYGSPIIPVMPQADTTSSQQSCLPLRVLLRSVIRSQSLSHGRESLHILGQVMSCQHPDKMKDHVLSSIVAEASLLTSNGPEICSEICSMLSAFWSQPKPLLHLSLQASRKRLGIKRLHSGNLKTMLIAPRIQHYLSYQSTLPLTCSQKQTTGTQKTETNRNVSILRHESLSDKIKARLLHTTTAFKRK